MSAAAAAVRTQAIAFLSSGAKEADEALEALVGRYGNRPPAEMFAGPNVLEIHEIVLSTEK